MDFRVNTLFRLMLDSVRGGWWCLLKCTIIEMEQPINVNFWVLSGEVLPSCTSYACRGSLTVRLNSFWAIMEYSMSIGLVSSYSEGASHRIANVPNNDASVNNHKNKRSNTIATNPQSWSSCVIVMGVLFYFLSTAATGKKTKRMPTEATTKKFRGSVLAVGSRKLVKACENKWKDKTEIISDPQPEVCVWSVIIQRNCFPMGFSAAFFNSINERTVRKSCIA